MTGEMSDISWERMHDNGWISVVYEIKEMNRFVSGAAPPGEVCRAMGAYSNFEQAKAVADAEVMKFGNHPTCSASCGSWAQR